MRSRGRPWAALAGLTLCALLVDGPAEAASGCGVVSVTSVSFGDYNPRDRQPLDSTGSIVFECRSVGPSDVVSIELSRSRASGYDRSMTGGGHMLDYNLYLDAARTQVWGDGTGGTGVYRGRPQGRQPVSVPVYGRLMPRQGVKGGLFTDRIVVTLVY
jgi:spore coat protein U-like protein